MFCIHWGEGGGDRKYLIVQQYVSINYLLAHVMMYTRWKARVLYSIEHGMMNLTVHIEHCVSVATQHCDGVSHCASNVRGT